MKANWINIDYTKNQLNLRGYVYYYRLELITDYEQVPFISKAAHNATFRKDSVRVIVTLTQVKEEQTKRNKNLKQSHLEGFADGRENNIVIRPGNNIQIGIV